MTLEITLKKNLISFLLKTRLNRKKIKTNFRERQNLILTIHASSTALGPDDRVIIRTDKYLMGYPDSFSFLIFISQIPIESTGYQKP